ncbi:MULTISPECIES: hypothetical protein [Methylorubrum]|jgi:hypothetical protein|uniref:Uncharacterized protein n=2 Tax=Methylorubrum extorquens TaxID=408 RepID=C5B4F9_METEA|nr:hypothetical protein [Methylorubrum extorquens]OAH27847.1 hypothetical protein AX289_09820 [Methylorubrum populi]ACS43341.1 Hypothetical protein MexAM1_META2p0493 [Methylorubrum extorquens AM1]EHP83368.1 hypothetical protein MetexDRAFT_6173 [Methylorubrum extorquens DSM 13060]MCP1545565.1 hypothetical protein [Methylorubrum extorquens]MCP1591516.1 hypothetical protein [Methylorubrum extorquens]
MSQSQALAIAPTVPAVRRAASPPARRPHAGARNFRFPTNRNNKGVKLGESAEDKAMIEAFIRDKGVSVLQPGHAWGSKPMPTFDAFAAPSF